MWLVMLGMPLSSWASSNTAYLVATDTLAQSGGIPLIPHAEILRDPEGMLDIHGILAREDTPAGAGFEPSGGRFAKGYTKDAYWLRLRVARDEHAPAEWWLVAWPPFINDLRLFVPDETGEYQEFRAGDHIPVSQRTMATRETVFPLTLDTQPVTIYLRIASNTSVVLDLSLWGHQAFVESAIISNTRHGLFLGLILTTLVISILSAIWLRQRFFYIATGYFFFYGALNFSLNGYDQLWIYPSTPWLADHAIGVLSTMTGALLGHFILSYLEPGKRYPLLTLPIKGIALLCYAGAAIALLGYYHLIAQAFHLLAILLLLLCLALMIAMLRTNRQRSILMLVMFAPPIVAVFFQILRNLGVLPINFWTTHLWELAVLFQIPFAAVVVLLRVREQELLHRAAQAREEAQRGLLSMIAHELRTPLTVINTAVANLEARTLSNQPELEPRYQRIHTALARLDTLVDNALAEDLLRQGSIRVQRKPTRPSELLGMVQELVDINPNTHELIVEPPADDSPHAMDPHWMTLALLNLLDNAVKYSPQGGRITCTARLNAEGLTLTVTDQGIGIPVDDLDRIQERFFRSGNAQSLPGSFGLGVGLYLVTEIARLHGGSLRARNERTGGSTFIMTIPGQP